MTPSISLIISTYNRSQLIQKAIDSIYLKDFNEIIIVDDCSNSYHQKQLEILLKNYPKIILLKNEENLGLSESRNRAIAYSKSEWIALLDDDDYYIYDINHSDIVTELKEFIAQHSEADILIHKIININLKTNIVSFYGKATFTLEEIRDANQISGTCLFKKSIWENLGGFKTIPLADWEFWIRVKEKNYNFIFFPEIFYCRFWSPDGMGNKELESIKDLNDWKKQWDGRQIDYSKYNNITEHAQTYSHSVDKKLVVQLAKIPCANAGFELSKLINAYSDKYESIYILGREYIDNKISPFRKFPCEYFWRTQKDKCLEIIKKADIIHIHHDWMFEEITQLLKNKIVITTLYDIANATNKSLMDRIRKYSMFITVADQPLQKEIYKYMSLYTLPLIKFLFNESTLKNNSRPLIVFAPTIKNLQGKCSKKREEVIGIIQKLKKELDFDFDLIEGIPYEENLMRKSKADIIIDDMNSEFEEFHCTSLEAVCFGAIPLTSYSGEDYPFIKTNINTLEETLRYYLTYPIELKIAQQMIVTWKNNEYTPEKLLSCYENLYNKLLEPNNELITKCNTYNLFIKSLNENSIYYWIGKNSLIALLTKKPLTSLECLHIGTNNIINRQRILEIAQKFNILVEIEVHKLQENKTYITEDFVVKIPKPIVSYVEKFTGKNWRQICS